MAPVQKKRSPADKKISAALSDSYRRFAEAVEAFDDFGSFSESLGEALKKDPLLLGSLENVAPSTGAGGPSPDVFKEGQVVLPVGDRDAYVLVGGRRDKKPFGPEDLHLMGAISDFVSALLLCSKGAVRTRRTVATFRMILDQLPLGVVCFGADRSLLASNKVAKGFVGETGFEAIGDLFLGKKEGKLPGHSRFHFEADGRLIYAEGRSSVLEDGEAVIAFLLYDMGARRDRLLAELDRQSYRSRCLGTPYAVAFFESKARAGAAYAKVKAHAGDLKIPSDAVQPVDAYCCACLFTGRNLRSVRFLLQCHLDKFGLDDLRLTIVPSLPADADLDAPGAALLETGCAGLLPAAEALRPRLACLEAYVPVADTLEILLEEVSHLQRVADVDEALRLIEGQQLDGLFFDLDGYGSEALALLREAAGRAGEGFRVFYSTYTQPDMARTRHRLSPGDTVLQKPFDAQAVAEAVHLQFNLA